MLWYMEHGEHEDTIREQMRINKMPAPEWIEKKPELKIGLEWYWKAFWELATCRSVTTAEGPIPWWAMNSYCERYGIAEEEYERFVFIIKHIDTEYLKFRQKKTAIGNNAAQNKHKAKKNPLRHQREKAIRSG